ncbi:MAG: response regulator [Alphaproteobacteria bacterium]|nr:response regulator [Alphaproteobacteria bacterium]
MKVIQESSEHHFLTCLESLKADPSGWVTMHFSFSRRLDHDSIIEDPERISEKLAKMRTASEAFLADLLRCARSYEDGLLYLFADNDVLLLAKAANTDKQARAREIFRCATDRFGGKQADYGHLSDDLYLFQRLADEKFLTARRLAAYRMMAEVNTVASIGVRRKRREDPLVLIVEDDRFTASYASNILNKQYDVLLARTGEEGIIYYIESAPDIVFLDIHLPGLTGHQTLNAIKKADPEAFAIMLSVDTEKTNVLNAHVNGAHGFLKKPFSKDRLLATVQKSPFIRRVKAAGHPSQTDFYS